MTDEIYDSWRCQSVCHTTLHSLVQTSQVAWSRVWAGQMCHGMVPVLGGGIQPAHDGHRLIDAGVYLV